MKRSLINRSIDWAVALLEQKGIRLPDFAYLTPKEWEQYDAPILKKVMLGWDVTDFNSGEFEKTGGVLFTLRNGSPEDARTGTPYAEKYIILKPGQALPMHMHRTKSEDIINRSGGVYAIQLYAADADGRLDDRKEVTVCCDGVKKTLPAGTVLEVTRGNSVTLTPGLYHSFWAGKEAVVIGEVSSVNDDRTDNIFAQPAGRFSRVEEDEPKRYVLCNEYE